MVAPIRHRWRLPVAVLAVATLVLLTWAQWRHDHAADTLLPLDPSAIQHISVTWRGHATHHYALSDGRWIDTDKPGARVDPDRIARLTRLAAIPVLQWRDADSMNRARIGLTQPALRVELDGQGLEWGALTALGPQRFVRVGRRIAIVAAAYSPPPPGGGDADEGAEDATASSQKS